MPVANADVAAAADRDRQAEPALVDRSAHHSGRRRQRYLLGNKAQSVPEGVRTVMEALATEGAIPITTLRQRNACLRSRTEAIVPDHLRDALTHGYIRPSLPPPAGYVWAFQPRPATGRRTYVLLAAE